MDSEADKPSRPKKWGFLSASAVVVFVTCVGELIGRLCEGLPDRMRGDGMVLKDWLVLAFFASTAAWAYLSRESIVRFFRTMQTGVSLVSLSVVAVVIGVLVPQIDGFEDPDQRVTAANYEAQYSAFRWAEGYFLYHMLHLYGIGMPEATLPPQALAGIERYATKYGLEEGDNVRKRMVASFTGTAKTRAIGALIEEHDAAFRRFFDVATFLHLNRAYKSYWFLTLVSMLGTAIFFNTFRGPPRTWLTLQRCGFFVTHLGMLTMLIGGGISKARTARGILHLDLRDAPKDEFWLHYDRTKIAKLPFHVGLERFARKEWMQLEVDFVQEGFATRPPTYTLWEGREIDLDYAEGEDGVTRPRTRLRVRELYDDAAVEISLREAEPGEDEESLGAIAQFQLARVLPADDHPPHPGHEDHAAGERVVEEIARVPAVAQYRVLSDPAPFWRFRVATSFGTETPDALRATFPEDDGTLGVLYARDKEGTDAVERPVPIRLGETALVAGGYRVEVREAVPNYRVDQRTGSELRDPGPLAESFPGNPAVVVHITPPGGGESERRVVRQDVDPVSTGLQSSYAYPSLVLYLVWSEWRAPGPPRYFLHWGEGGDPVLVGQDGSEAAVRAGERLPLPGDTEVVLTKALASAVIDKDFTLKNSAPSSKGEVDPDFYARVPRGLVLDVIADPGTPAERIETVKMVSDGSLAGTWRTPDGRIDLRFFENTALMPFEWRSVLSIWDEDESTGRLSRVDAGSEREREIRVNDYLYWKGYRFFQTNADANFPSYSGIGIVYDPGIPVVLLGMYTIIAGTVLAFLVRPIVKSRRKRARKGA